MKLVSIIGTRPQYIKIKPFCLCLEAENINHVLVDTNQHYSANVSEAIIHDLNLRIDYNLYVGNTNTQSFQKEAREKIAAVLLKESPDLVVVIGDTNSTVAGALAAQKTGLPLVHLEAGIRCGDINRPEEANRIQVDEIADLHFISREKDAVNVANPQYIGDLEYALLNLGKPKPVSYNQRLLMTVHRQENTNKKRLNDIFEFCSQLGPVLLPIHHRTKSVIADHSVAVPSNIKICEPFTFHEMVNHLTTCRGVLTDSGGVIKMCPFFGKKCVILMNAVEWDDVISSGYGTTEFQPDWFKPILRNTGFYYNRNYRAEILDAMFKLMQYPLSIPTKRKALNTCNS